MRCWITAVATAALEQGLLDPREAAAQDAHDQVVVVVGLCAGRTSPVELLQQRNHPIGDSRQHIAMRARGALDDVWGVHRWPTLLTKLRHEWQDRRDASIVRALAIYAAVALLAHRVWMKDRPSTAPWGAVG